MLLPGTWPAFYEAEPGHILWVDFSGFVVNGGWKPTYSDDKLTCWWSGESKHVFRWAGNAPDDKRQDYNDVIGDFLSSYRRGHENT